MKSPHWHMDGSATRRFRAHRPELELPPIRWQPAPPFVQAQTTTMPLWDDDIPSQNVLDNDLAHLAWELARLAQDASAQEALFHLGHALLQYGEQGSTFVPLGENGALPSIGLLCAPMGSQGHGDVSLSRRFGSASEFCELLKARGMSESAASLIREVLQGNIPDTMNAFVGAEGNVPFLRTATGLALHRFDRLEGRLAAALAALLRMPPLPIAANDVEKAWAEIKTTAPIPLTNEQQWALFQGVHLPFTVIAGGPGTGKTTIVVSLLRMLARLGVAPERMALAAPTGKAANRMYEVVQEQLARHTGELDQKVRTHLAEPRTLHRLLGYSPSRDRFDRDEHQPLDADVVIVDESSMVDVAMMAQLFRACAPRHPGDRPRRLLLLGDSHQLPSVEAGMVFQHLSEKEVQGECHSAIPMAMLRPWSAAIETQADDPEIHFHENQNEIRGRFVATLTKSHRMNTRDPVGKAIYQCAMAVQRGDVTALRPGAAHAPVTRKAFSELTFVGVEHVDVSEGKERFDGFLHAWWERRFCQDVSVELESGTETIAADDLQARVYRLDEGRIGTADLPHWNAQRTLVESQRILCLMRGQDPAGAAQVNAFFEMKRKNRAEHASSEPWRKSFPHYFAGEPVLFTHNDYDLGLFNGDQGLVLWTQSEEDTRPKLRALFSRAKGVVAFELEHVRSHLQRAYALTVHKAQGSQMACAALLLPAQVEHPLLVRQLVYTAISRASRSVIFVGSMEALYRAAVRVNRRHSALMEKTEVLLSLGM